MEERLATLETRVRDLQAELEDLKLNIDWALSPKGMNLREVTSVNRNIAKGIGPVLGNTQSRINRKGGKTRRSRRRT
jgi:hypothetical protein